MSEETTHFLHSIITLQGIQLTKDIIIPQSEKLYDILGILWEDQVSNAENCVSN